MTKPIAGIKVNADQIIDNIKKTVDLTKDFRPLMLEILGKDNDPRPWTIKGSILRSFIQKRNNDQGEMDWVNLSPGYQKYKSKKYPGKPMMVRTGDTFNSLVRKNQYTVQVMTGRKLTYGTTIDYLKYNQSSSYRTSLPRRAPLGFRKDQRKIIKKLIGSYVAQVMNGDKPEVKGVK